MILSKALGLRLIVTAFVLTSTTRGFADLVAHWPLDEGGGEEFLNLADDELDGYFLDDTVIVDWVTVEPNADGYGPAQEFAVEFLGDNSWIQTDYPGIGGDAPRTVAFWVQTTQTNTGRMVAWGDSNVNGAKWHIRTNDNAGNGIVGAFRTEPQGGQNVATTVINDGQWHHVVSVFPEGATTITELRHYVDGFLDPRSGGGDVAVFTTVGPGADPVTLGRGIQTGTPQYYAGLMADVRIYDEELSDEEIRALAGVEAVPCESVALSCEVDDLGTGALLQVTVEPADCVCRTVEVSSGETSLGPHQVPESGLLEVTLGSICLTSGGEAEVTVTCTDSGVSAACAIPCPEREGLVAHWPLDEGEGDDFVDLAGGFDGFLEGGVTIEWVEGPPTQEFAVELSGDNSWINTDFPGIGGGEPRTVAFWVRTTYLGSGGMVAWGDSTVPGGKWHIRVNDNALNGVVGAFRTEPQDGQSVATTLINDGEWHHVASVFPAGATGISDLEHYVDGMRDPRSGGGNHAVDTVIEGLAEPLTLGKSVQEGGDRYFAGAMADVRVYDIALNEDEIRAVMEGEVSTSPEFLRGDADGNGALEVTDPILNLTFQFVGGVEVTCMDALDDDDSGAIDVSDPIYNLTVQFIGGPAIPAPGFEVCGPDPTEDALSCEAFPACS